MEINKIAVIGSRNFDAYLYFCEKLEYLISNLKGEIEFVSGGCKSGGDALLARYCKEHNLKITEYLPDYVKYTGKVAPIKRNDIIVENSTHLIAFWDGLSRGTSYTLKVAEKKGIPIKIVKI